MIRFPDLEKRIIVQYGNPPFFVFFNMSMYGRRLYEEVGQNANKYLVEYLS